MTQVINTLLVGMHIPNMTSSIQEQDDIWDFSNHISVSNKWRSTSNLPNNLFEKFKNSKLKLSVSNNCGDNGVIISYVPL